MLLPEYTCPRCGMKTKFIAVIKKHFYNRLRICPALIDNIDLTDDVKQYVIINRIYRGSEATEDAIQNVSSNVDDIEMRINNSELNDKKMRLKRALLEYKNIPVNIPDNLKNVIIDTTIDFYDKMISSLNDNIERVCNR